MGARIPELLDELIALALLHPAVETVHIRSREHFAIRGYLRMRLGLRSQDLVEIFVYLVAGEDGVHLKDYSIHWQQPDGTLRQRWDNAPHHAELANFPYHTHRSPKIVEATPTLQWEDIRRLLAEQIFGG
jgi:hypothetical protein